MRFLTTVVLASTLALPAMAQTTMNQGTTDQSATTSATSGRHMAGHRQARRMARAKRDMVEGASATGRPGHPTENDKGPFTPEANRAYEGGGAVTTGQPGNMPASPGMGQPMSR